jgi:hypothetical protein
MPQDVKRASSYPVPLITGLQQDNGGLVGSFAKFAQAVCIVWLRVISSGVAVLRFRFPQTIGISVPWATPGGFDHVISVK